MNPFHPVLAAVSLPSTATLLGLLLWVAIAAVVIWAIYALLKWSGIVIPAPIRIIFIALVCIVAIVFMFRAVGLFL